MFLFHHFVPFQAEVTYTPTYYCPQVIPDDAIDFTIIYQGTDSWYCPQTLPDTAIITGNALSANLDTVAYLDSFIITFNTTWVRTWNYTITGVTSDDINGAPLTGSFTANGQTLTLLGTPIDNKTFTLTIDDEPGINVSATFKVITYCAQDTSGLPNPYDPIPADGTILYCAQDTSLLPNPYSPIPADGTIIYCAQDTTGLPTP